MEGFLGDLFLYSTNPVYSHELACKYLNGKHFVWCSHEFNPVGAPSSSPGQIYKTLWNDCEHEDTHSNLIKGYKKTFRRLANAWLASGIINNVQKQEVLTTINSGSWKIWRPQIYIIYRPSIEKAGRLKFVPARDRAAYGDEWKIEDLDSSEFEILGGIIC